jgi:Spy/CpxP family protein refolding chaperone
MRSDWMMRGAGAVLALVVVVGLGATMALSKPRHGSCHEHGSSRRLDRLEAKLADLALDAETRASAEQVLAQARTERETQREEMRDARGALRELLAQDPPALEQVMAQADAIGALETESHKARLRTMIELRSLLGAERWQELKGSRHHERDEPSEKS